MADLEWACQLDIFTRHSRWHELNAETTPTSVCGL